MTLRTKALLVAILSHAVTLAVLYLTVTVVIGERFHAIEQSAILDNVTRAEKAIDLKLKILAQKTSDWAYWDDTYDFVEDRNAKYLRANLSEASGLEQLDVSYILIFGADHEIIASRVVDPEGQNFAALPPDLLDFMRNFIRGLTDNSTAIKTGVTALPSGISLFAAGPILPTSAVGTSRGSIVFGHRLDQNFAQEIAELAQMDLTVSAFSTADRAGAADVVEIRRPGKTPVWINTASAEQLVAHTFYDDVRKNPALELQITLPREIYAAGIQTVKILTLLLVISGVFSAVVVLILLDTTIISGLKTLNSAVEQIGSSGEIVTVKGGGRDEIGGFITAMNNMLLRLKQTQIDLSQARDKAENTAQVKSMFVATLSHEVRTPVNGILSLVQIMQGLRLSDECRRYLKMIQAAANGIMGVINDILDYSKIEAGKLELDEITYSLEECIQDTLGALLLRIHEKGLEFCYSIDPANPRRLIGDPLRLRQIITNLVGNAIKFTEKGAIILKVENFAPKETLPPGPVLKFSISDSGIGIPADKIHRLFSCYSQVEAGTARKYGGTGLGLSISKQLVELMGGSITVDSTVGVGTTFVFAVPYRPALEEAAAAVRPDWSFAAAYLLVNSTLVRDNLCGLLHEYGVRVEIEEPAAETLPILYSNLSADPAQKKVVFIDADLPQELIERIIADLKESADLKEVVITVLLPAHRLSYASSYQALGVAFTPTKPLYSADLARIFDPATSAAAAADPAGHPVLDRSYAAGTVSLKILVADDSEINRSTTQMLLEEAGHRVVAAANGKLALQALEAEQAFDVVLLDIEMPILNGLDTAAEVRAREQRDGTRKRVPLIAITGHVGSDFEKQLMLAGFDAYVVKPYGMDNLITAIGGLIKTDSTPG